MTISQFSRIAGALALTLGLAGCIDATVEVDVTSPTTAKATMTQVMEKSMYDMVKAGAESGETQSDFCEDGEVTVEGESATCVISKEGKFDELTFDEEDGEETLKITPAGPGLVRVAFPTEDMKGEIGADDAEMDAQTKAMMVSFFEGHSLSLKVSGGEIVESNMDIAGDKRSAEKVIPFLDLINGDADLPDELYAVVKK